MQDPPTLDDFENTRQKLIVDLKEAKKLSGTESKEVCTVEAALKYIEEKIATLRKQ